MATYHSKYLPVIKNETFAAIVALGDTEQLYDVLTQPLHEALYQQQSFDFFDALTQGQQLLIAYDYLRMQVNQGGFIQFIHNGYVFLLPDLVVQLNKINAPEMAQLLDDVLKVFVLNKDYFTKAVTVAEFARIYDELQEFIILDERFALLNDQVVKTILDYALNNIAEFAILN